MTYAHLAPQMVVFGGVFEGDGTRNAHGANERYNIDSMLMASKIYAEAILQICE